MAKGNYQVPYDKHGNLLHYAGYGDFEWRDNTPFEASIQFNSMSPSWHRSAKYLMVQNVFTGATYPMFVRDTLGVLQWGTVKGGVCTGTWVVQKRGQNYGIRLVEPDEQA